MFKLSLENSRLFRCCQMNGEHKILERKKKIKYLHMNTLGFENFMKSIVQFPYGTDIVCSCVKNSPNLQSIKPGILRGDILTFIVENANHV